MKIRMLEVIFKLILRYLQTCNIKKKQKQKQNILYARFNKKKYLFNIYKLKHYACTF